ncbi:MAG: phage holin family protein [Candidatus Pacebacteria bacterium]|nr:phage holin family protein [Candidatus Paceibacterota bacterium]
MKILKPFIATLIALVIVTYFFPNITILHWTTYVIAALVITLLNKIVRPILKLLFLPINIVTLGLFSIVIHVGLLWLATYLVPGFKIDNMTLFGTDLNYFFTLLVVSIILGFFQGFLGLIL